MGSMLKTINDSTVSEKKWAIAGKSKITRGMARQCARHTDDSNRLSLVKNGVLLTVIPCFKIYKLLIDKPDTTREAELHCSLP